MQSQAHAEKVRVSEIFKSIQGETTRAGLPCVFVRLAGCSAGCAYCDTAYAQEGGKVMSIGAVVEVCEGLGGRLVAVTGGEPLEQEGCPVLVSALLAGGWTVLVETNGLWPIDVLPAGAIRIMDLKCPSSGVCDRIAWRNVTKLTREDEVKCVIADRADYEWARAVLREYDLTERCGTVLMGVVFGRLEARKLVEWILEDGLAVRFQLQLHKVVWPPDQRGV